MKQRTIGILFAFFLTASFVAHAAEPQDQRARPNDPQAVQILKQAMQRSGLAANQVTDMQETGSITYYWAGQEVTGPAKIQVRGNNQIKVEADLPEATRYVTINNGRGSVRQGNRYSELPYHATVNYSVFARPYFRIAELMNDPGHTISYVELMISKDGSFHHLRIDSSPASAKTAGDSAKLDAIDLYVDAKSLLLVGIETQAHPIDAITKSIPQCTYFSDYRQVNGSLLPFSITETLGGQRTWKLELADVRFNAGLPDSEFNLNF